MKRISGIQTNSQTGLLVDYEIEDYGETGPFFLPDDRILQDQIAGRQSRSWMPKEFVYKSARDFDWTQYSGDIEYQKKVANAFVVNFNKFRSQGRGLYIHSATKGSGKTALFKAILKVLFGSKSNVNAMPEKLSDIDALMSVSHLLLLDNFDTHKEGINDKFAVYATGGNVRTRKLYTNSEVHTIKLDAFLGFTTRTLSIKRDDILQRLILLKVKPIENGYIPESKLFEPILKNRNKILSYLIKEVQRILRLI